MNKAELLQLLQTTDLPPEALKEIASLVQKHRVAAHDSAMETIEGTVLNSGRLVEIWNACYGDLKKAKSSGMTAKEFEAKMQSNGFSTLFREIKGDDDNQLIFLTDKSGMTWGLPLNHTRPIYLPSDMFDKDAIESRFDAMKKLVAPCRGRFEDGQFQVETIGKVV